jgi:hypothetical protein
MTLGNVAFTPALATSVEVLTCKGVFEATVYRGPDAGLSLVGELTIEIEPSGELVGVLVLQNGSQVPVTGEINRQKIKLELDLGDGMVIRGKGKLDNHDQRCTGATGGTFVGPNPGDRGDWGFAWGS